ncbi:MAG: sensor histidine kinase [Flavobacteriales bacterium]
MTTSKRLYWGAQLIGWTSYASLIFLATYAEKPDKIDSILLTSLTALVFFGILWTHIMRQLFIRLKWLEYRLSPLIPRVLFASLLCSLSISFSTTLVSILIDPTEKDALTALDLIINVFAILVLVLFWNSIYFTFHFFQKSRKQELNNISLEASRNEIELKNLRSQLNPHFLFNSLNSIRALIDLQPSKAKESVTTLSNLLRRSLILGKENLVTLEEELEMVSNYLELEKIRFEERLEIKWILDDSLRLFLIPPFSMQMLVENAIKHGISNLVNGGIIIILTKKDVGKVIISISNSGKIVESTDTGIGIENTKRRLALQFKDSAEFELFEHENLVTAQLTFKQ